MNPLTNTKNQNLMNERELKLGYTSTTSSWHRKYKDSAWIFAGGINYDLTEGDLICVFSQYGEITNINLVRDKGTGKSKGFCFVCYADQRSTVLATDNFNGIKLAGRTIRVDHVENYKIPKEGTINVSGKKSKQEEKNELDVTDKDEVAAYVREHGCGPEVMKHIERLQKKHEKKLKKREKENKIKQESMMRCPSPPDPPKNSNHSPPRKVIKREPVVKDNYRSVHSPSRTPSPPRVSLKIKTEPTVVHNYKRR